MKIKNKILKICFFLFLIIPIFSLFPCNKMIVHAACPSVEIERKFKINQQDIVFLEKLISLDPLQVEIQNIIQTYIDFNPETRVRKINSNGKEFYTKTIKTDIEENNKLSRIETEENITQDDYEGIIKKFSESPHLKKNRYKFKEGENLIELDIYDDGLKGLVIAEVEFDTQDEALAFVAPAWFGQEVTNDKKYKNSSLAKENVKINKQIQ